MNLQALTGELKRLESLMALAFARTRGGGGGGTAAQNYSGIRATGFGVPHNQTQSNANSVILAGVAVQPSKTGFFDGRMNILFASDTAAKIVELSAVFVPVTGPVASRWTATLPATIADIGGNLSANETGPVTNWAAGLTTDALGVTASGMLFNGTAPISTSPGAVVLQDKTTPTVAGQLSAQSPSACEFSYAGQFGYNQSGSPIFSPSQIAAGCFALLVLQLTSTAGTDVVHFGGVNIWAREIG
jgi:hypothetical protein